MSARHPGSKQHAALNARRWAAVRRKVFSRDGYRCRRCHRPGRLECDHITPLWQNPTQDPYGVANCQTLCRTCHIEKTRQEQEQRNPKTPQQRAWRALVAELANS